MESHLDQGLLEELRDVMEDDFPELLSTYLTESENQLSDVESVWEQRDMDGVRRSAHKLKGSCTNIGANDLAQLCLALETAGRDEDAGTIAETMPALVTEFAVVRREVSEYLHTL